MIDFLRRKYRAYREKRWYDERQLQRARQIDTHMTEGEKVALAKIAASTTEMGHAVEVGSYLGASSCYIASAYRGSGRFVYCVDTWTNETMPEGDMDTFASFSANTRNFQECIRAIRSRSEQVSREQLDGPIAFVFVDGDHSYQGVKSDFARYGDWLIPGGILAMHDILYYDGVREVLGEALLGKRWDPLGVENNLIWLRKRYLG